MLHCVGKFMLADLCCLVNELKFNFRYFNGNYYSLKCLKFNIEFGNNKLSKYFHFISYVLQPVKVIRNKKYQEKTNISVFINLWYKCNLTLNICLFV